MKLTLPINEIYSYKKIEEHLINLHLRLNQFTLSSSEKSIPHLSQVKDQDQFCFLVESRNKKQNIENIIVWIKDLNTFKKVTFNSKIKRIFIYSPENEIDLLQDTRILRFYPEKHLKKLDFSDFYFLALPENLELNLNNALINTLYTLGVIPFHQQFNYNKKVWGIQEKIDLSFQHSLIILRKKNDY